MEEATVTAGAPAQPTLPPECEMTTDDLVLMIGEAAVNTRQDVKIKRFLSTQAATIQKALLQERSQAGALAAKITTTEASTEENARAIQSFQSRITQLEDQVYMIALERDAAKKLTVELQAEVNKLAGELKNRPALISKKRKADYGTQS